MKLRKRLVSGLTAAAMIFGIAAGPIDESGILSKLFDRSITASAMSLSDCYPTPYETVAFKANSNGKYLTCDIGGKNDKDRYTKMDDPDLNVDASKVQAYEMFELIPCTEGENIYALRSIMNREYLCLSTESSNGATSSVSNEMVCDFIDVYYNENESTTTKFENYKFPKLEFHSSNDNKVKINYYKSEIWLCVKDNKLSLTTDESQAEEFTIETVSNNAYTAKEMSVLSNKTLYNGEYNPSYWKIQSEIGEGKTDALKSLGYTTMYRDDQKNDSSINHNTIIIDNMECAIGVKKLDNGKYDVLITFQGTGGYGTHGFIDQRDSITNTLGATYVNDKKMHQGYCDMAHKLYGMCTDVEHGAYGKYYGNIITANVDHQGDYKTLNQLIDEAKNGNAHFTILGHSMGGAIAQCYALYLHDDCGVTKSNISGRTFNSALAISYDEDWPDKNSEWDCNGWYNICVSTDTVPNGLVPGSIKYYGLHRLGKTIWLYDDTPDQGTAVYEGVAGITNISPEKHEMQNKLRDRLEYIRKNLLARSGGASSSGGSEPEEPVFDEDYFIDRMFRYRLENDWAVIVGYIGEDTSVSIPSEIKGYKVEGIDDNAFYGCTSLASITIPDTVSYIGESAFSGCTSLTSLIIPESVGYIRKNAFYGCKSLKRIVLPDEMEAIGESVFEGCSSLTSILIPNGVTSIGNNTFYGCTGLSSVAIPDSVTYIGDSSFYGCSSLTSITIPKEVTSICDKPFQNCTNLESINVASGNEEYSSSNGILYNKAKTILICCPSGSKLTNVIIPNSVKTIYYLAFENCTNLRKVTLPSDLSDFDSYHYDEYIGIGKSTPGIFEGCSRLEEVTMTGETLSRMGANWFGTSSAKTLILTESIPDMERPYIAEYDSEYYGYSLVPEISSNNDSIENIIISDGITRIGAYAFFFYTNLKNITIPDSVKSIGWFALSGCRRLAEISIPNSVTDIEERAFEYCLGLKSVTVPDSVTELGNGVFSNCTSLAKAVLPEGTTTISDELFYCCDSLKEFKFPSTIKTIESSSFLGCTSLTKIDIPEGVTVIDTIAFSGCSSLKEVALPESLKVIAPEAFSNCTSLKEIRLPDDVEFVAEGSFKSCTNLEKITMSGLVNDYICDPPSEYLEKYIAVNSFGVFEDCENVKTLVLTKGIDDDNPSYMLGYDEINLNTLIISEGVTDIPDYSFANLCYGRKNSGLEKVVIPNTVKTIGQLAFLDCENLKKITIPKSVTSIGDKAFGYISPYYDDNDKLPDFTIYGYTGTAAEKYAIENGFTFIPLDGTENAVTLDINLNATDKTMSSEDVSISVDGEEVSTSENGKAELTLADGTHEITFSAHGFVPRTYTVEVMDGQLTEELTPELNLYGDTDGNGVVNTLDVVKLKRHLINIEPLTGYALDCANTDGNDTINTLDVVKLKRHLINIEPLW